MATMIQDEIERVRNSEIWRTIFRSGSGSSNLHRSQAVQQNIFLHLFSVKVRSRALDFSPTWYLGALTLSTFFILIATGILLMFYYHPSVPQAYADMKDLQFVVASGVFLRNLHRWSAHAMVFLVFAHMFKVFYRGAYRPPRQFNWVVGVFLLLEKGWARIAGIVVAGISAIINFSWLPYSPWWALLLIAVDILVIWALATMRRASTA